MSYLLLIGVVFASWLSCGCHAQALKLDWSRDTWINALSFADQDSLMRWESEGYIDQFRNFLRNSTLPIDDGGISKACSHDLGLILNSIRQLINNDSTHDEEFLAHVVLPMIDATAKIPPGILRGHIIFYGMYRECMVIEHHHENRRIQGSYGRIFIDAMLRPYTACSSNQLAKFAIDVCLPKSCIESDDFLTLARKAIKFNHSSPVCNVLPVSKPIRETDHKTWIVVGVMSFVVCLAIISTLLDIVITYFLDQSSEFCDSYSTVIQWFMTFSVIRNTKDVFSIANANKPDQIGPLHCMRFVSIAWVVFGHSMSMFVMLSANPLDALDKFKDWGTQFFTNAYFAVDTFFFMSGLLVSFVWFKLYRKNPERQMSMNAWIIFYLYRIIRLSPSYFIVIAFYTFVFKTMIVNMPMLLIPFNDNCENTWWNLFLYINNYINYDNQCYIVSWYLATDLQMYLFAPILLVPLALKPRLGVALAGVLLTFSTIGNFASVYAYYFPPSDYPAAPMDSRMGTYSTYTLLIYDAPWIRCQVYIIGILTGYLLQTKKSLKIPRLLNLIAWLLSFAVGVTVVLALRDWIGYGTVMSLSARAFYSAFSRIGWGLAISYIIIACFYGYGGPINDFMSLPIWIPFSRLTYCIYLVHPLVMICVIGSGVSAITFSSFIHMVIIFGIPVLLLSTFAAYVTSILFEIPIGKFFVLIMAGSVKDPATPVHDKFDEKLKVK